MILHPMILSTTEPNNHVGVIKARQGDNDTQTFMVTVTEQSQPKDYTGYEVFFCIRTGTTNGIVENKVITSGEIIDAKTGKFSYTLTPYDWQRVGVTTAYFDFRKLDSQLNILKRFSTRDFSYTVTPNAFSTGISDSNYVWTFEDLLRMFQEFINNGQTDFDAWFERIKDTLSEDAAGSLAMAIQDLISGSQTSLVEDIYTTSYKKGQLIDVEKMRYLQSSSYYQFLKTLRDTSDDVSIKFLGDSLTYGSDVTSSRPGANGSGIHRATTTYPEAVEQYLNEVYVDVNGKGRVSTENHGFPGDWSQLGYERNSENSGGDLTILMYGTNDSRRLIFPDAGNISVFLFWYEQLIIRELLWGNPVLLISPPKTKILDVKVDTFRQGIKGLADKYNIPLIDATQMLESYSAAIFSDDTHFHDTGYKVIGSRVAASLIGAGPHHRQSIYGGSIVLSRPTLDNVVLIKNTSVSAATGTYAPTPNELNVDGAVVAFMSAAGGKMIYSFYCEHENMIAMPYFLISANATVKYTLDFGVSQAENALDTAISDNQATLVDSVPNSFEYTSTATTYGRKYLYLSKGIEPLRINQKGWHTLLVENTGASVAIHGIEFFSFQEWSNLKRIYALEQK